MMGRKTDMTRGMVATVLAALLWSTGGLLIKLVDEPAFTILFYRSLYAGLFFLVLFGRSALRWDKRVLWVSLCYAPLLMCFVTATKLTTAANAIFLQYTAPAIVLLLEPRLTGGRIRRLDAITVLLCLGGLSLFLVDTTQDKGGWLGNALALLSGFFLAGLILTLKFSNRSQQAGGIVLGNLWVVLATLWWGLSPAAITLDEHGAMLFLGIVQIGTGYVLFTYGQRRIPAIDSSLLAMLEPVLNPVWVAIGYGEWPSAWSVAGGAILLAALCLRTIILHRQGRKARRV